MTIKRGIGSTGATKATVAPWWHTALVVAVIAVAAVTSGYQHGLPHAPLPGVNERVSSYLTVIAGEWSVVLLIAWGLRFRGLKLRDLVSGDWPGYRAVLKDLALAMGFFVIVAPSVGLLAQYMGADSDARLAGIHPRGLAELVLWGAASATAGFCEELAFRGYLSRQFSAWTGSRAAGLVLQAIGFGVAHAYYNSITWLFIAILGLFLGLLAAWRKSLRPSMLAHGLMDFLGGLENVLPR